MLLAFGLMGIILVGSNWIYHRMGLIPAETPATQSAQTKTQTQQKATPLPGSADGSLPGPTNAPENTANPNLPPAAPVAASNKQTWFVDTDVFHVVFSNEGAVVQSWTLKKYHDAAGQPLELVNQRGALKEGFPLALQFRRETASPLNKALWEWHPRGDGLSIEYDYSDGHTVAKKVVSFTRRFYLVNMPMK